MGLGRERAIGAEAVEFVGALEQHEADRRVMADLLKKNLCAIFHSRLVCLSQDRIQWLFERVCRVAVRDRKSHQVLHPLDWVRGQSCGSHVSGSVNGQLSNGGEDRSWGHALDWE